MRRVAFQWIDAAPGHGDYRIVREGFYFVVYCLTRKGNRQKWQVINRFALKDTAINFVRQQLHQPSHCEQTTSMTQN